MATKEHYDVATEVLQRFILLLKDTGSIHGMSYAFSPRKAQMDYLGRNCGIMIRKDEIFVHGATLQTKGTLPRVRSESTAFQLSCTGEYFCDKAMEELILESFTLYHLYLKESLYIGDYWED